MYKRLNREDRYGSQTQGERFKRVLAEMELPLGWRHPVTGREGFEPEPGLILLGAYVRRGRYISGLPQRRASWRAGITQSMWSRLERGLAPSMDVERLPWVADALFPNFPLGFCPHVDEHVCRWQPLSLDEEVRPQLTELELRAQFVRWGLLDESWPEDPT